MLTAYFNESHAELIRRSVRYLLTKVRPNAIALTDALNYTNHDLNSALGNITTAYSAILIPTLEFLSVRCFYLN
jgi:hypothetical protein